MERSQSKSLAENLTLTVNYLKNIPKNSMIQINYTSLRKVFDRYRMNFYSTSDYIVDEDNKKLLEALILLFSQSPKFINSTVFKNNPGLDKGIYSFGNVGTGKTDFFEIMKKVAFDYIQIHKYRKLDFHKIHAGHFVIQYAQHEKTNAGDCQFFYEKHLNGKLLIDELGREPQHYGREIVCQLILDRYRRWKQNKDIVTYITSNFNLSEIEQRYGDHLPDRIIEMCNVIHWPGESRRK